jgi:hypothetical protein
LTQPDVAVCGYLGKKGDVPEKDIRIEDARIG